jgi:hypothetical protein
MRLVLLGLVLLFCIGVTIVAVGVLRGGAPDAPVEASIGDAQFSYPAALARDEETAAGGLSDRLAFVATFPDFGPRPPTNVLAKSKTHAPELVLVTIAPKDEAIDPADRPARLYARFLEAETQEGPGGLVLRHFEKDSPYDLEQLYVTGPDGGAFFARCPKPQDPKPQQANGEAEEPCLFLFRDGALDVELRFKPTLLEQWETLNDGARAFVERLRARPAKEK